MGVKSTVTLTRAGAELQYASLYAEAKAVARRAKTASAIEDAGVDAVDAAAYHGVDARIREDGWREKARRKVGKLNNAELEDELERLNDVAHGGQGFDNYVISEDPSDLSGYGYGYGPRG